MSRRQLHQANETKKREGGETSWKLILAASSFKTESNIIISPITVCRQRCGAGDTEGGGAGGGEWEGVLEEEEEKGGRV